MGQDAIIDVLLIELLDSISGCLTVSLQCAVMVPERRKAAIHANCFAPVIVIPIGLKITVVEIGFDVMECRQKIRQNHPVEISGSRCSKKSHKGDIVFGFREMLWERRHPTLRRSATAKPLWLE